MSDRLGIILAGGVAWALAGIAVAAAPLAAQSTDEWRARLDAAVVASARADSEFIRIDRATRAPRTAHIVAGDRRVSYAPGEISSSDSARIAEGLTLGRARLIERFGTDAARLLDTATWIARGSPRQFGFPGMVAVSTAAGASSVSVQMARPVDPSAVAGLVMRAAGDGVLRLAPALRPLAGGTLTLDDDAERFVLAGREMSLSWAASGRRCMTGAVVACRAVLTTAPPDDRLALYFDPSDWQAVVTSGESPAGADSVFFADRRSCLRTGATASDLAACARIVGRVRVVDPFSKGLRATLVMHAFELGASSALQRLAGTTETDPMRILTTVAGVGEEALIASWQRRIETALADEHESTVPLALSILGWGALAVVGVARRKP